MNQEMIKNIITVFFIVSLCLNAQTSITISGRVEEQNNSPIESTVKVSQLVAGLWEFRGETTSDINGDFSLSLDNVTSIESSNLLSYNYSLQGNVLTSPGKAEAEIIDYTILGEEASRKRIELLPGRNIIKNNLSNLSNGIYIRSIHLKEGIITQKIVKQGNTLNYGTAGINNLSVNPINKISLNKVNSDSLYIMTIASKSGYLPDTIITSVSRDNPKDIVGLKHKLNVNENYISAKMLYVSSLGEKRINEPVELRIEGIVDTTIYSDGEGILTIALEMPQNREQRKATITFPDYEDRLNTRVIHKKGTKLDQKPLAITNFTYLPFEVYGTMQLDLDSLKKYEDKDLALFDFQRYYQTNQYINNGVFDMRDPDFASIFKDGYNITWTADVVDTLWFITSNINQHYGTPVDPDRKAQLDTTLTDMIKMLKLEGTGIEEYNRVNIAPIYETDDVDNNDLIDYLYSKYDGFNYARFYFSNSNGNNQGLDNLKIKNTDAKFIPGPTNGNIVSESIASIGRFIDPPTINAKVGDFFHSLNVSGQSIPGYKGTVLTEAAWGCIQIKFLLPQGYPVGR